MNCLVIYNNGAPKTKSDVRIERYRMFNLNTYLQSHISMV